MTYNDVKSKYAQQVAERRSKLATARRKVDVLEAKISYYTEEREQFRSGRAPISAETAAMWNYYSMKLTNLAKEKRTAEDELLRIEGGATLEAVLNKIV